jgi:hypothetical protein
MKVINISHIIIIILGYEILTTVIMNSTIFWDIKPCSSMNVNRRVRETSPLEVRKLSEARNHLNAGSRQSFISLFFDRENGDMFLRNVG